MRKHITQAEVLRIEKLLRSGVNTVKDIQGEVFVHAECIKAVAAKYKKQNPGKKAATKKAPVDPIS